MTREEAIHIVDVAFGVPQAVRRAGEDRTYHEDEIREAKEMAMAALKAEPCDSLKLDGMLEDAYEHGYEQARHDFEVQPCKDAISRKHLLSEIGKLMQSPWFNNGKDDDMFTHYGYVERKEAVEIVRDLCVKAEPSVTPNQKIGKWMKTGQSYINPNKFRNYCCSKCGWELDEHIRVEPHYCPNCGAKMGGENK